MQEETLNPVEEKPIAAIQMTFEQLLETKLQEETKTEPIQDTKESKPKREFLRKGSNSGLSKER